jgi:hypothetical protein
MESFDEWELKQIDSLMRGTLSGLEAGLKSLLEELHDIEADNDNSPSPYDMEELNNFIKLYTEAIRQKRAM